MVAGQIRSRRHQFTSFKGFDPRHVIGDETVAPFNQAEHALALADPAGAADQDAHSEDIDHATELRDRR